MKGLSATVAALLLWAAVPAWQAADAYVRQYRTRVVRCGAAAAALFSSGVRRSQVRVMNLGNATVFVGETGGTLTTANGWPLHAASIMAGQAHALALVDTQAGMDCITADTNSVQVGVLEELE